MHRFTKIAAVSLTALMLGTNLSAALDLGVKDNTPIDVRDNTPINVISDPTPINIANPKAGLNDAVLNGKGQFGRHSLLAFACSVGGNELLVLANKGDAVPAGTKLKWEIASTDATGYVRLKSALGTGETVKVDFGGGVNPGTPCAASAI